MLADLDTKAADFLVEARGIFKRFGATEVLKGVDFAVRPGEVHALLGGNGAVKSTLIKIITGAPQRDAGELSIDRHPRSLHEHDTVPSRLIAVVHQEMALLPHLRVAENISLPQVRHGWRVFDRGPWSRGRAERAVVDRRRLRCAGPRSTGA